jgi:hypothetical protein
MDIYRVIEKELPSFKIHLPMKYETKQSFPLICGEALTDLCLRQ